MTEPDEIIVLSDLHIGRGKNPESGRYFTLEAFFYDDDFLRFCRWLCTDAKARGKKLKLVLNGDVFDLLRIEPEVARPGASLLERTYGQAHTPVIAARLVKNILGGHRVFLQGLATVLREGHQIILLPGNHDIETQWEPVRAEIRAALDEVPREHVSADEAKAALERLRTWSWFYYEPGRIWIEHGCQYDPENAFRYLLRAEATDASISEAEHDLPLGNFFQRYLYNFFGHITFIVPSARANLRYLKWMMVNQPRLLFDILARHVPFVFQVIRRLAKSAGPAGPEHHELKRLHEEALARLAEGSGLGEKLHAIDRLKEVHADVVQATRTLGWQFLKMAAYVGVGALLTIAMWFVGFMAINELRAGFGLKAFLFLGLNFVIIAAAGGSLFYSLLRYEPISKRPFQRAAQRIVELLDVPIVTFGHTHDEVVARLSRPGGGRAWYYNTGTWIAVFTHDVLVPRERVQYTFLRVRGNEPELLHWSPGRGEPLQVIMLDELDHHHWHGPTPEPAPAPAIAAPPEPVASPEPAAQLSAVSPDRQAAAPPAEVPAPAADAALDRTA